MCLCSIGICSPIPPSSPASVVDRDQSIPPGLLRKKRRSEDDRRKPVPISEQTDLVQPHQTAGTDPPTVYLVLDKSLHYTTGFLKEESHSFSPQKNIFRDNVQTFQDSIPYVICSNILSHFCTKNNRWISNGIILRFTFAEKYLYNLNVDYNPRNWEKKN